MKMRYDPQVDALRIKLRDVPIVVSEELEPGVIIDLDEEGQVVAIEVLFASERMELPPAWNFEKVA